MCFKGLGQDKKWLSADSELISWFFPDVPVEVIRDLLW